MPTDTTESQPPPTAASTPSPNATSPSSARPGDGRRPATLSEAEGADVVRRAAERTRARGRPDATPVADALPDLPPPRQPFAPVDDADERRRRDRVEQLLRASGVPALYADADLSDLSRVPPDAADGYAGAVGQLRRLLAGPALVALLGGRGPGKTWMGCGLVRAFCLAGRAARYLDAMDFFVAVKETFSHGAKLDQSAVEAGLLRPELVVIDEVHERGDTPWEDRMLTRLVNKRYAADRATVLISNQTAKAFRGRVGESIADRMVDRGGVINCGWASLRGRVGDRAGEVANG